jgi:hypothetical protein
VQAVYAGIFVVFCGSITDSEDEINHTGITKAFYTAVYSPDPVDDECQTKYWKTNLL